MNVKGTLKYRRDLHEIFSNYFFDYIRPHELFPNSYTFENEELSWTDGVWSSNVEGSTLLPEVTKLWLLYLHNDTERLFPTYTWEWNGDYGLLLQKMISAIQQHCSTIIFERPFTSTGPTIRVGWAKRADIELWIEDNKCLTKSRGLYELLKPEVSKPRKRSVTI